MFHSMRTGLLIAISLLLFAGGAGSQPLGVTTPAKQEQTSPAVPPEAGTHAAVVVPAAPEFDVKAAVDTYLAKVPPDKRAKSDAYFEGGYWLTLWDFLYGAVIMLLLLATGASVRMRDFAERIAPWKPAQTAFYFVQFLVVVSALGFPLTYYEGFVREHKYGLATQTFGLWMRDQVVGLTVALVLGSLLVMALFGVVRRVGKSWWVWGAGVTTVFFAFAILIGPVYIAPLFNTYKKLADPKIKETILSMARANGIPVTEVYEMDASRQTTRVSANVSGFLGTERITLNDNLLRRCSPAEIQAVMGHEMGHYVLNHAYKGLVFFGVIIVGGFAFLNWGENWSLARWGQRWGIHGMTDVAVIPLVALIFSIFGFVTTPITNTIIRTLEYEADLYGLNASQQPDGEAEVDLKLGEYRKLDPGPIEEFLFFDHPSGRTRITAAMRWKKEHLRTGER